MKTLTARASRLFLVMAALVLAAVLGGCASPSNPSAMVATTAPAARKNPQSFSVNVIGGSATSAMAASQIANEDFAKAIRESVLASGLFAKEIARGQADYDIDVQIVRLVQPLFGASFTVTLEATWRLSRHGEAAPLWERAVTSSYTAKMGDSLVGVRRLRLATEGAARSNIEDALKLLAAVDLK